MILVKIVRSSSCGREWDGAATPASQRRGADPLDEHSQKAGVTAPVARAAALGNE